MVVQTSTYLDTDFECYPQIADVLQKVGKSTGTANSWGSHALSLLSACILIDVFPQLKVIFDKTYHNGVFQVLKIMTSLYHRNVHLFHSLET